MLTELVALHQDATFQMIRQPECATVMEEKEREVIQLQRELMEAHATIGRLQAKLDGGEQEAEASCSGELVSAAPWSLVLHNVDDFAHQTQSLSNNEGRHVIDKRRLLNLHLRLADSEGNIVEPSSVQVGGFALEVTVHVAGERRSSPRMPSRYAVPAGEGVAAASARSRAPVRR